MKQIQKSLQKSLYLILILSMMVATLSVSGCTENADKGTGETKPQTIALNDITDINWQWSKTIETEPASQTVVPNPERYTLTFSADGTYSMKADCNGGGGSYTLEGGKITINPGAMTLMYCGDGSLDGKYLAYLGSVTSAAIENDQLVLYLGGSNDKMLFIKG